MHDATNGVRPKRHSSAEQDPSLTVQPLFADGRKRQDSQRASSSVGLLLHRPVDEVVKVQDIMSAIDDMLREMTLEGYVLPVAQSEVVKTLKEIRSSGRLMRSHKL
jgi:hypothetical protein